MTELDELERDLLQAADTWFNQALHQKLKRLISIGRLTERPVALAPATPPEIKSFIYTALGAQIEFVSGAVIFQPHTRPV